MQTVHCRTLCADLGGSRVKLAAVEDGRVLDSEMFPVGANTAETLAAVEDAAAVRAAVAALPEVFREVVVFRYFEDMSVPEIAQVLGVPEGSVKSRLNRAKLRIRNMLSGTIGPADAFKQDGTKP